MFKTESFNIATFDDDALRHDIQNFRKTVFGDDKERFAKITAWKMSFFEQKQETLKFKNKTKQKTFLSKCDCNGSIKFWC